MSTRDELQDAMDKLRTLIAAYKRPANDDIAQNLIISRSDNPQFTALKTRIENDKFRFG